MAHVREYYSEALTRTKMLQQHLSIALQKTKKRSEPIRPTTETPKIRKSNETRRRRTARSQLAFARNKVLALHRNLELAKSDSIFIEEEASASRQLSIHQQTMSDLLLDLQALASGPGSSVKLLANVEKRCVELAYKAAALEEELKHFNMELFEMSRKFQELHDFMRK